MKRGKTYDWIPLWRQKWLWGSTRLELNPAERSIWIDLLCIAGNDDGNIRANPDTAYGREQLAGMLVVPIDVLNSAIEKCIKYGKLEEGKNGTLYIKSWPEYQLNPRHKKRFESQNCDIESQNPCPYTDTDTKTNTDTNTETDSPASEDVRLVQLFIDLMLKNNPESSIVKRLTPERQAQWITQCRLLREADNKTIEEIEALIRWSQADPFWKTNILSIPKLREKWDQLWMKAKHSDKFSGIREWLKEGKAND